MDLQDYLELKEKGSVTFVKKNVDKIYVEFKIFDRVSGSETTDVDIIHLPALAQQIDAEEIRTKQLEDAARVARSSTDLFKVFLDDLRTAE